MVGQIAGDRMSEALLPPIAMLAELTHRCPLQCPYCSNPTELMKADRELGTDAWLFLFGEAADLGVLQVHLSGGEPTVRRDLEAMIAALAGRRVYTNLITSGIGLTEPRIASLADAGLDHLQLSIQGARPSSADRIAHLSGAHERKCEVARMVRTAGLPLTINAPIHRHNIDDIPQIIDLAVSLGAERLEIASVQYAGWALINRDMLMPDRETVERQIELVEAEQSRLKGIINIDFVAPDYFAMYPKPCMGGWARDAFVVAPDGSVLPCHAAQTIPGLNFDRYGELTLAEIWTTSRAFAAFRGTDWMQEPCRSCERREIDWGGCRCQAMAIAGDAAATDPACVKSPLHERMSALVAEAQAAARTDPDGASVAAFTFRRIGKAGSGPDPNRAAGRPAVPVIQSPEGF
jgi:pyrroloquinoline quinone biosynthesis protein E